MILNKWYMDKYGRYWKALKQCNVIATKSGITCTFFCINTENEGIYINKERQKHWKMVLVDYMTDDDVRNGQLAIYGH